MADYPADLVRALPKAELHVHLEGTVDAQTLLDLHRRHGVQAPAPDVEGINAWFRFDGFPMFLERYFAILDVLRDPADFALIAERYLDSAADQGVVHVEFHVSATGHIVEGRKAWAPIHDGIVEGCRQASAKTGISWGLIPDVSPHLGATATTAAMEEVFAHDRSHILAVGMGGPSDNWTTENFAAIYRRAAELGIPAVAHAAEHGGPDEVVWAVEQFGAQRIQHGIGAMADPAAVQLLLDRNVVCDVCPGSNLALNAVESADAHPLGAMLDAGITVTLGSDDPPLFRTRLLDEYERAWMWCDLDVAAMTQLARNSIEASFAPPRQTSMWLERFAPTV